MTVAEIAAEMEAAQVPEEKVMEEAVEARVQEGKVWGMTEVLVREGRAQRVAAKAQVPILAAVQVPEEKQHQLRQALAAKALRPTR